VVIPPELLVEQIQMTDPVDDMSMRFRSFEEKILATREIAVALAELIFKDVYGEENFKAQLPLVVTEASDRWIIEGSKRYERKPLPFDQIWDGNVIIEILKFNCQVIKLAEMVAIGPRDEDPIWEP
jgi:hypothetical protein